MQRRLSPHKCALQQYHEGAISVLPKHPPLLPTEDLFASYILYFHDEQRVVLITVVYLLILIQQQLHLLVDNRAVI